MSKLRRWWRREDLFYSDLDAWLRRESIKAWVVVGFLLIVIAVLSVIMSGCAARSYSSTDQKVGEEQWDYKPCPIELRKGEHDWCWCVDREDDEYCQPE